MGIAVKLHLRLATLDDAQLLFDWRNDHDTRANSRNTDLISWDTHVAFLKKTLERQDRKLLIAETDVPVGTARIDYGDIAELS